MSILSPAPLFNTLALDARKNIFEKLTPSDACSLLRAGAVNKKDIPGIVIQIFKTHFGGLTDAEKKLAPLALIRLLKRTAHLSTLISSTEKDQTLIFDLKGTPILVEKSKAIKTKDHNEKLNKLIKTIVSQVNEIKNQDEPSIEGQQDLCKRIHSLVKENTFLKKFVIQPIIAPPENLALFGLKGLRITITIGVLGCYVRAFLAPRKALPFVGLIGLGTAINYFLTTKIEKVTQMTQIFKDFLVFQLEKQIKLTNIIYQEKSLNITFNAGFGTKIDTQIFNPYFRFTIKEGETILAKMIIDKGTFNNTIGPFTLLGLIDSDYRPQGTILHFFIKYGKEKLESNLRQFLEEQLISIAVCLFLKDEESSELIVDYLLAGGNNHFDPSVLYASGFSRFEYNSNFNKDPESAAQAVTRETNRRNAARNKALRYPEPDPKIEFPEFTPFFSIQKDKNRENRLICPATGDEALSDYEVGKDPISWTEKFARPKDRPLPANVKFY